MPHPARNQRGFLARRVPAAVALSLALAASPAGANVFGTDDRRPLLPEDDYGAIGQIACENSTRLPVGTVIDHPSLSPDRDFELVISVAHAFLGPRNRMHTRCEFRPGGDAEAARPVLRVSLGTLAPGRAWHHDWAVAMIARDPDAALAALPLRTITQADIVPLKRSGARYVLVGKNGERPRMLISENCGPVPKLHWHHGYFTDAEFNHDCDMIAGWSGGPLVLVRGERRHVVAVNATELNSFVHKEGDPWNARTFPNTAIRIDGDFKETIDRMAAERTSGVALEVAGELTYGVLPEACTGADPDVPLQTGAVELSAEIALMPAAHTASC